MPDGEQVGETQRVGVAPAEEHFSSNGNGGPPDIDVPDFVPPELEGDGDGDDGDDFPDVYVYVRGSESPLEVDGSIDAVLGFIEEAAGRGHPFAEVGEGVWVRHEDVQCLVVAEP